jgi:hypothetical protein
MDRASKVIYILYKSAGPTGLLPGLAGEDLTSQWIGMVEYIPCFVAPVVHWGLLPATRLASRKILTEHNIKRQTGPALYVFSLLGYSHLSDMTD